MANFIKKNYEAQRHFRGWELKGGLISVGSEESFSSVEEFGSSGSQWILENFKRSVRILEVMRNMCIATGPLSSIWFSDFIN